MPPALPSSVPDRVRYAAAFAGPLAIGGALAARTGIPIAVIGLPLIVLGVSAVTTPALYIATAATGMAPPAAVVAAAVARALGAMGIVLLGVLAPVGFLVATSERSVGIALITLALGGASVVALTTLRRGMFDGQPHSSPRELLFAVWSVVTLIIAARLYTEIGLGGPS
jgi:hypothetical protein